LPACNTLILDEAHQLPDTATLFFGEELTSAQLAELARDAEVAARTDAREVADLPAAAAGIGPAIRSCAWRSASAGQDRAARRGREGRLQRRGGRTGRRARSSRDGAWTLCRAQRGNRQLRAARHRGGDAARALAGRPHARGRTTPPADSRAWAAWIRWVDITQSGWQLNASPLSVADVFGKRVVESGTRVDIHVRDARRRQGLFVVSARAGPTAAATGCWDSPFDYESQALLYVPRDLPQPNSREHTEAVVAAALPGAARERRAAHSCCSPPFAHSTSRARS
jgi:ATP-dependent DNA helicase DinG